MTGAEAQTAAVEAVRTGNVHVLRELLAQHPKLAGTRPRGHGGRTLLHVATDWPGHLPQVAATIAVLVAAGADPDAACAGRHPETPLHWAASSDDVAALDALLDAGADIHARGAVIGGGTAMADATAFAQWHAARRLLERGSRTTLFEAAALGLTDRVSAVLAAGGIEPDEITGAFWGACHGGRPDTAQQLLAAGADVHWVGWDDLTPLDAAVRAAAAADSDDDRRLASALVDRLRREMAPDDGAPSNGAPSIGAPDNGAPDNGAPDNGAPDNGAPSNDR